jgi:hypothetical protein
MKQVRCQNHRQHFSGDKSCGKFLVSIPDCILSALKVLEGEEEGKIIVQCGSCRSVRFAEIKYVGGELTWESVVEKPNLGEKLKFKNISFASEAPLIGVEGGEDGKNVE